MEKFLEANRIVESSLAKLNMSQRRRREGDMPLRKALLVSSAMSRAQEVAECAHLSLVGPARGPSRLLASMRPVADARLVEEDTAVGVLMETSDTAAVGGHRQLSSTKAKCPVSPVALSSVVSTARQQDEEEVMEFIPNSVLSEILADDEVDSVEMDVASPSPLTDVSNTLRTDSSAAWPAWTGSKTSPLLIQRLDSNWTQPEESVPTSPGKRHHDMAFPVNEEENTFETDNDTINKRFKSDHVFSTLALSSSPLGFCDYLSPRTLCSAPLITYMFGKGFATPSDPSSTDWPTSFSTVRNGMVDSDGTGRHYSSSRLCPVLAY